MVRISGAWSGLEMPSVACSNSARKGLREIGRPVGGRLSGEGMPGDGTPTELALRNGLLEERLRLRGEACRSIDEEKREHEFQQ